MATKSLDPKPTTTSQKKVSGGNTKKVAVSKKSSASSGTSRKRKPTFEEISLKAHDIYLERIERGEPGNPDSDWQKALDILQA